MRNQLKSLGGLLGGLIFVLLISANVAAYAGQVAGIVEVSGPSGAQPCNTWITVTARAFEVGTGEAIEGQPVDWSFLSGNLAGDQIRDTSTVTDANGVATTQVRFSCSPHSVTIQAVADQVLGTAVLNTTGDALPSTDTVPASSLPGIILAALAVLIGSGTILRRFATDRR